MWSHPPEASVYFCILWFFSAQHIRKEQLVKLLDSLSVILNLSAYSPLFIIKVFFFPFAHSIDYCVYSIVFYSLLKKVFFK